MNNNFTNKEDLCFNKDNNNSLHNFRINNENNTKLEKSETGFLNIKNNQINNNVNQSAKRAKIDEFYIYYSNIIKSNIFIPPKNIDVISRIDAIIDQEGQSDEYRIRIVNLFKGLCEYIKEKDKKNNIRLNNNDEENIYVIKRIKISDVYDYITKIKKDINPNTKKYNLSRIRKFVRMLNYEPDLNYNIKIGFSKKKECPEKLQEEELFKIINYLKGETTRQQLLIFYFLYYGGLSYSLLSRITIKDLKNSLKILIIKKRKIIKRKIPDIIRNNLYFYITNKKKASKYLFYDSFDKSNLFSRTKLIRNNIIKILGSIEGINNKKIKKLINIFSKNRKSKNLPSKYYYLFDYMFSLGLFSKIKETKKKNTNDLNEDSNAILMDKLDSKEN